MKPTTPSQLVAWLKAAGESSRLRLLALCAEGALTVSDLAQALRQSEPRVSRHLRVLCEAGLVARAREGQWVRYGLTDQAEAASFIRGLLLQLDRRHPQIVRDLSAARAVAALEPHSALPGAHARLERALRAFIEASAPGAVPRSLLMVGVAHLELLTLARSSTVIVPSRRAGQAVRSFAEARGLDCRVLGPSRPGELAEQDLARAGGPFDAVLLSPQAQGEERLAALLAPLARRLAFGGRLWVLQRYESLESSRERVVEHPLARLRRLLGECDLECERLSPIEADGEHLLVAAARPRNDPGRAAVAQALEAGGSR